MTKYEQIENRILTLREASYRCYANGLRDMADMFTGFLNALMFKQSIMSIEEAQEKV